MSKKRMNTEIKFEWTENTLDVHQLIMKLKSTFFSYTKPILVDQEVFPLVEHPDIPQPLQPSSSNSTQ